MKRRFFESKAVDMVDASRQMRMSSTLRGFIIAALILAYGWISRQPGASLTMSVLIGAGLQCGVIAIRRFVAAGQQPQALYLFEMIIDGVTVLLFALGVFGGILKVASEA